MKDTSGEINGTVHNNVLEEYEADLRPGTGIILKDVSVFSPNIRKHYVNITPANIVQVFPADVVEILATQTQNVSTQLQKRNMGKNGSYERNHNEDNYKNESNKNENNMIYEGSSNIRNGKENVESPPSFGSSFVTMTEEGSPGPSSKKSVGSYFDDDDEFGSDFLI